MTSARLVFAVSSSLVLTLLAGCGAPPAAKEAPPPPAPATAAPRCAASEPNQPTDLRDVMKKGGSSVKGCFMLGKATSTPGSMRVSLRVASGGDVKTISSSAPGSEAEQISCVEGVLKKLSFARFCGDEVEVSWTYALGS